MAAGRADRSSKTEAGGPAAVHARRAVIAVDAAPGKASTVFDGQDFMDLDARSLGDYLARERGRREGMLVCWDAPLTGPRDPDDAGEPGDLTQRLIESFFRDGRTGFKPPEGISVRGYGGCPHWTISRSLLGLPRLGPFDLGYAELPFDLLPGTRGDADMRPSVVEIHPGLAAWLWCREERAAGASWAYKKDAVVRREMWKIVLSKASAAWEDGPEPANDDEFDAAVGYALGRAYSDNLEGEAGGVAILGNRRTGSFLLPEVPGLRDSWRGWLSSKDRD